MENLYTNMYNIAKTLNDKKYKFSEKELRKILKEEKAEGQIINKIFSNPFLNYCYPNENDKDDFIKLLQEKEEKKDSDFETGEKIIMSLRNFIIYHNCETQDIEDEDFNYDSIPISILFKNKKIQNNRNEKKLLIGNRILKKLCSVFDKMIINEPQGQLKVKILIDCYTNGNSAEEVAKSYYINEKKLRSIKINAINSFCRTLRIISMEQSQ